MLGALSAASPAPAQPQGGAYKVIRVDAGNAGAASSQAILAGDRLYLAAQDGRNGDGSLPTSFPQEVQQALARTRKVLDAAGMDMGNLVWIQVYVTSAEDLAVMNDVYWKSIGANPPARTVLVVAALPGGEKSSSTLSPRPPAQGGRSLCLRDGRMEAAPTPPASWWTMFCMSRPRMALIP